MPRRSRMRRPCRSRSPPCMPGMCCLWAAPATASARPVAWRCGPEPPNELRNFSPASSAWATMRRLKHEPPRMRFLASLFNKPSLKSPLTLAWLTALWLGVLCNWPLWQRMSQLPEMASGRGLLFIAVFMGIVTALLGALLSLLAWRRILKPVLALVLLSAAALAHFMGSYGIVVDPTMVVNIVQTDAREAGDLLSLRLGLSLLLLAGLPIIWLWRRRVDERPCFARLGGNLLGVVLGLVLA
eukprot:Opistho-1_new@58403